MARILGIPNRNRERLMRLVQEEWPKYNSLVELLRLAKKDDTTNREKIDCHKTVSKYLYPTLKTVEISGGLDGEVLYKPIIKRFDGSLSTEEELNHG